MASFRFINSVGTINSFGVVLKSDPMTFLMPALFTGEQPDQALDDGAAKIEGHSYLLGASWKLHNQSKFSGTQVIMKNKYSSGCGFGNRV